MALNNQEREFVKSNVTAIDLQEIAVRFKRSVQQVRKVLNGQSRNRAIWIALMERAVDNHDKEQVLTKKIKEAS